MPIPRGACSVPRVLFALIISTVAALASQNSLPLNARNLHNKSITAAEKLPVSDKVMVSVKNFASLGDSYAAGVGAGSQLDSKCWQYSESYPAQLNNTDMLKGYGHSMQFLACTGTVMRDDWGSSASSGGGKKKIIWDQIDAIKGADFVTLSIGGNDAGFFDILNGCIYKFYGPASPSCENIKKSAREKMMSKEFRVTYNKVLDAILTKNSEKSFRIFVTGYSKFFDDKLTDECSGKSLGYWAGYQPRLTVKLRRDLNDICGTLNEMIGQIIAEKKDERVIWVNWAPKFDSHRFCQPGKGLADKDTWFYDAAFRRTDIGSINPKTCETDSEAATGDWGAQALCAIAVAHAKYPALKPVSGEIQTTGGRDPFGPNDGRLFHPKPEGYRAIVDQIREVWPYAPAELRSDVDDASAKGGEPANKGIDFELAKRL
ncbi:hypothetical protein PRK78_006166 [Emydomyces testavorans]|uniref:SGNH hydrolase-type esterase domain-containing protein n=1 Tax=Emydomyces testavorans TaxID=2070801 RepID=A0AAF0DLY3_9EURO|nr:hypothetical protein PRK78_006166 [Emydomyces testavorans]